MSDVITTERIDGHRLSIILNSVRDDYYLYDVLIDTSLNDDPCCIGQIIFNGVHDRKDIERATAMLMSDVQRILTALINALPDAESVRNGVHEL
jgi:hypothetical protein